MAKLRQLPWKKYIVTAILFLLLGAAAVNVGMRIERAAIADDTEDGNPCDF